LCRVAAAVDAFLLKIMIEERIGWPVQLISDGLIEGIDSVLNLSGVGSVYSALASGAVHIYPEARVGPPFVVADGLGCQPISPRFHAACSKSCFG
jgi:hypothetical protein